jgi:hypothetical protein
VVTDACKRLVSKTHLLPVTRRVTETAANVRPPEREWRGVERVTLIRNPVGWLAKMGVRDNLHAMSWLAPELTVLADWTDGVAQQLGGELIKSGYRVAGEMLIKHQSSRVVMNRMNGTPDVPSQLGLHEDPLVDQGVNLSLTVGNGMDLTTGELVPSNTLNVYAAARLAHSLGTIRPEHGFSSTETRYSLVFINPANRP